ncbi:MAG: tRNA (N6-isopentenyl adenosine(37)-C2)-methylthiotransferase MiaB [Candidatus Izemoplasmatales bacterium]|jgi:tRNA-2-methylthio-N6-dimethylallyladenosine synthase
MQNCDYNKPQMNAARKRTKTTTSVVDFAIPKSAMEIGIDKKYILLTYGCQGNESDSEKIRGLLETIGFSLASDETMADLIVLNTCAIRANAENKVFGELGRLKKYVKAKPDLIIAIGGCMPQEEIVVEKILKTYPQVKIIFGTHNLYQLPQFLERVMSNHNRVIEVLSEEGNIIEKLPTVRTSRSKAWVDIMYGCDEFCTYCIVPYTRGKERSRKPEYIIKEVQSLIDQGYHEVTLLGQNVNSYGLDFTEYRYRFSDLLQALSQLPIERIRFTTSHPKDFSTDLITVLAKQKNLMHAIHLPVQSGSDKILKAMNRKYTKADYMNLVDKIYQAIPDVSLTTDIIVGFPGETESDFLETIALVEYCRFEGAYTFVFSPRVGTPAAQFNDTVSIDEKMQRLYRLNDVINQGFARGNHRFVNQTLKVLVDGRSKGKADVLSGYSEHNKLVNFRGSKTLIGTIVNVKITDAKTWSLAGKLINE